MPEFWIYFMGKLCKVVQYFVLILWGLKLPFWILLYLQKSYYYICSYIIYLHEIYFWQDIIIELNFLRNTCRGEREEYMFKRKHGLFQRGIKAEREIYMLKREHRLERASLFMEWCPSLIITFSLGAGVWLEESWENLKTFL